MGCDGCKYQDCDGYDWPCADCNRIDYLREDMYEPEDEEDEEDEEDDE